MIFLFSCLFAIIPECEAQLFLLFGRVIGVIDEPGLHFLPVALGPHALLIRFFGAVRRVDLRLDQEYLRSEPVNSEEGTPMGLGVCYEMRVTTLPTIFFGIPTRTAPFEPMCGMPRFAA